MPMTESVRHPCAQARCAHLCRSAAPRSSTILVAGAFFHALLAMRVHHEPFLALRIRAGLPGETAFALDTACSSDPNWLV